MEERVFRRQRLAGRGAGGGTMSRTGCQRVAAASFALLPSPSKVWKKKSGDAPHSGMQTGEKKSNESHPERMCKGHGDDVLQQENPLSSVVFFGEVQRSQAAEAQAAALRVKAVHFSVLTLKQVLDPLRALLLQRRQLLFNLSGRRKKKHECIVVTPDRFFDFVSFG